ncbi:helix-turn-helix transcriptional regulator [Flavobacterium branchiicola]|uniref:HTH luxR-type domain-containing protein n=1 Tax=Flavobacterium branchiicola TaxID=1114875 RepID=A0ABV9PKZ0_9FLAO|nr:hypothetical protein [Flavobacterium branchiicola]MBS7256771.1 hypothetical protein [Flavobacterium branchiicola]
MLYKKSFLTLSILFISLNLTAQYSKKKEHSGWSFLINDNLTFCHFFHAYEQAEEDNNIANKAEALLYLGIWSYGHNLENGLQYAKNALVNYSKLEKTKPAQAKIGKSKCLQLIGIIYTRQGKYAEAASINRQVIEMLGKNAPKSGILGSANSSTEALFEMQSIKDSAISIFRKALKNDFENSGSEVPLVYSYLKIGEFALKNKHTKIGLAYFGKALNIAELTHDKKAQFSTLIMLGKCHFHASNFAKANYYYHKAHNVAITLSDKIYEIKAIQALIGVNKLEKNHFKITQLQNRLLFIKDHYFLLEKEKIGKSLEMQFKVGEKNKKLASIYEEKKDIERTNCKLLIFTITVCIILLIVFYFLHNIHRRDKQLLHLKNELVEVLEKEKKSEEKKFQNDLEHKENQLSSITLQIFEKNKLLNEIKVAIEKKEPLSEQQLLKLVNRHLEQNILWNDFDLYFESINKNFYTRLKQSYPEISSNDLKICALVKLNMSVKEMSLFLNISPDSVKTARYRLRKKLQLSGDQNLTDIILSI